ncbi:MAG: type V CRISPR-associated protein Cas12b [Lachnospiraceae bacterium]|nr:type V CRISPR-associated protein Cas12b [Lachnospiraceae bacterium]
MAVISIKLKAYTDKEKKEKIFAAHKLFNQLVARFEELLKLIRQKDYYYLDEEGEQYKSEDEVKQELMAYLKQYTSAVNVEQVMELLKRLEDIIMERGSQCAAQLVKIYNKDSTGGTNNIEKIVEPEPEWVQYYDEKTEKFSEKKYRVMADAWLASEEGQKAIQPIINGSGRSSAFKKAYLEKRDWYKSFVKDQKKYRKDLKDGLSFLLSSLEKEKVFPLIAIDNELIANYSVYVKLALKTALENFASYLACDEKTRNNFQEMQELFMKAERDITENYAKEYEIIKKYLDEQYEYTETDVYLTKRMTRGVKEILTKFKKCANETERLSVIKAFPKDKMGDYNLFHYLALEEVNKNISFKAIQELIAYYQKKQKFDNARKCAAYTTADAINSKRYLMYENAKGSNYKKYKLFEVDNHLFIKIPILLAENNKYFEEECVFELANSKQFSGPIDDDGKKMANVKFVDSTNVKVCFTNSKKIFMNNQVVFEEHIGMLGGADIRPTTDSDGNIKDVFVSLPINVDNCFEDAKDKDNEKIGRYFLKAYDGKDRKEAIIFDKKRIRALSVDLGLKQIAACSVGSIIFDADKTLQDDIVIERSFHLALEGEKVSGKIEKMRNDAMLELNELRTQINYLSFLKRVYNSSDIEKRKKLISSAIVYTKNEEKLNIYRECLQLNNIEAMNEILSKQYDFKIREMNDRMSEFRSSVYTRKGKRKYCAGKSYWSLMYLEQLRKVIISWNSLSFRIYEKNTTMTKQYGVTATKLLKHINHIKEDRIKTAADLIVQSARGYIYDNNLKINNYKGGAWNKKYDECNVIIFEDLRRYSFTSDRPKQENSKLMRWTHSALIDEVKRQATIYGICVVEIAAGFTSKFFYENQAPGIRCDRLTKNDFDNQGILKEYVANRIPEEYLNKRLEVGSLVPSAIGSIFVSLNKNRELICINADINASLNLLHRFFEQQTMMVKVPTRNKDGKLVLDLDLKNNDKNKLLKGKILKRFGTLKLKITKNEIGNFKIVETGNKNVDDAEVGQDIVYSLFNDNTGVFFENDEWVGYTLFWEKVKKDIDSVLLKLL